MIIFFLDSLWVGNFIESIRAAISFLTCSQSSASFRSICDLSFQGMKWEAPYNLSHSLRLRITCTSWSNLQKSAIYEVDKNLHKAQTPLPSVLGFHTQSTSTRSSTTPKYNATEVPTPLFTKRLISAR